MELFSGGVPRVVLRVLLVVLAAAASHLRVHGGGGPEAPEALELQARVIRGDVHRALDAVERLAQFLDMHEDAMTKDLALGAAISESAVQAAAAALRAAGPRRAADLDSLAARLDDAAAMLRKAMHTKLEEDDDDDQGWRLLLQPRLWRPRPGRDPPPRLAGDAEDPDDASPARTRARTLLVLRELALKGSPTEEESARCIGEALREPCLVPAQCVRAETLGAATGYSATHRLLYHHVVNQVGCEDAALGVGTEEVIALLCRRILQEATAIASAEFPPLLRDLFAEQVALCGARDFPEFARRAWLDEMLFWQRPAGCFGNYTELQQAAQPFHVLADNARLDDPLGSECVSHLTGVAAAAVAFNLRVLVQELLLLGDER